MSKHLSWLFWCCALPGALAFSPGGAGAPRSSSLTVVFSSNDSNAAATAIPTGTITAKSICFFDESDFAGAAGSSWPYSAADLNRLDNSADGQFYAEPRFVTHIDDGAIASLTAFYKTEFTRLQNEKAQDNESLDILDLCSSWISHFPKNDKDNKIRYGRVVGLGMNEQELAANQQLTEHVVQDLNINPSLEQFADESFDVICNVVSVDYLTKPLEVFQEMHRCLKPGGVALMSFSNRCFPTKAIAMWLQADDIGRLTIVASYFHYASAAWQSIEALNLKGEARQLPARPSAGEILSNPAVGWAYMNSVAAVNQYNQGNPMFMVKAVKQQ